MDGRRRRKRTRNRRKRQRGIEEIVDVGVGGGDGRTGEIKCCLRDMCRVDVSKRR